MAAHREGIVTSASLMVRWPAALRAAALIKKAPELSIGLHIDLEEWIPTAHGWQLRYQVLDGDESLEVEIRAQLERFMQLVGRHPTHLDSHQHVHLMDPCASVVLLVADELNVPVRILTPEITYCGRFYGHDAKGRKCHQFITPAHLVSIIESLPSGVTELSCHPCDGRDAPEPYSVERAIELETLCHPRVAEALETRGVALRSFAKVNSIYPA